ncbi:MAG TPA: pitrilysin family protein [Opitutaceae bacterium]|nr:pitrilysin family protein [Opitutaceae bacterium]
MPNLAAKDLRLLDALWREPLTREVLPNGLTLVAKADRSAALASVQVWVRTGSIHEGERLGAGLSHYLEHMLFKGTERRAGRDISASVQAHGGYINAYTTFDHTVYYIDLPSEHAGVAIDILADAVLHSRLPEDEAAKEKEVILREIAMTRDDPDNRVWEALFAAAFREHPYRQPIIGHRDVFAALTHADLVAYYRARYVPENLTVVVVGDIDPAAVRAAVETHFGGARRTGLAPVLVPAEPLQLAPREDRRREEVELTRGVLAWPIPGLTHPDAPLLDLLAMVLGHGDSSVLWREVRERARLVHTIDASSWNPGSSGLFCIAFTCEPAKRAAAEAAVEKALRGRAAAGFTPGQLAKAVRQMVVAEINTRKTMSGQASRLGAAEVVVGDLGYSRAYFERLRGVTAADLRRVLKEYLQPARRTAVSLEPLSAPAPAAAPAILAPSVPDFALETLPNGARLMLQTDRRLPSLHLRALMEGGPHFEEPGRRGATALLATMLAKDTRRRSAAAVAQAIEEVGGSFYPFSGNNSLGLAAEVLTPDGGRALEALAGALLEPAFLAKTFGIEREAQLAALRQDTDEVVTFARKEVRKRFFGSHPLALDAHGDEAGVRALSPADLAALHRRLCVGSNVVLAVAGDIPAALVPRLRAFLGRLPRGAAPARAGAGRSRAAAAGNFVERQPREQAVVLQAFPGPSFLADDFYVGEVADELFSGMASRLFERVREEKGLAYFVRSARVSGLDAGMFCFYAGTQPGKEDEVLAEIEAEIARIQGEGAEPAELDRCQARLKAARRQSLQTNGSRAMQGALDVLLGRPLNDWKNYDARIEAVSRADLGAFARRYFQPALRTQLVVRP